MRLGEGLGGSACAALFIADLLLGENQSLIDFCREEGVAGAGDDDSVITSTGSGFRLRLGVVFVLEVSVVKVSAARGVGGLGIDFTRRMGDRCRRVVVTNGESSRMVERSLMFVLFSGVCMALPDVGMSSSIVRGSGAVDNAAVSD